MPNLLSSLLKQAPHNQTRPNFRIVHDHLFDKLHELRLQKAPIIDLQLVIMDHLELVHPLIQADLIVPLEPDIDRTGRLSWRPLSMVIEIPVAKPRLVPQVTA